MSATYQNSRHDAEISEEVQELIKYKPHWVIRKGSAYCLLIFLSLLAVSVFVRYPDIIHGSLKLVAVHAPKLVVTTTDGKLQRLLVGNNTDVQEGQALAFLQSTGSHEQVISLNDWIKRVEPFILKDSFVVLQTIPLPSFNQLGEVQTAFQDFQNAWKETLALFPGGYYQRKRQALEKDLQYVSSIQSNQRQQRQLLMEDYSLQLTELTANDSLLRQHVIAPIEFNQNKSKAIGKEEAVKQMDAQLVNNEVALHDKQKELLELSKFFLDQRQKFQSELLNLKSRVESWLRQYVLVAPEDGKVLYASFLEQNQVVTSGQELFYVQPHQSSYYGQLTVSQTGLGKVHRGQRVVIRVESYPSAEFGYLTGTVSSIAYVPTAKDGFLIRVDLPGGLRTNYGKQLVFRNNLLADAGILADDRRLFDRIKGELWDFARR